MTAPATFVLLAGLFGAAGVAAGAFGAHAMRNDLSASLLHAFEIGVQYHLLHTVALLGVAWLATVGRSGWAVIAGWLMVVGIVLFSGSLYALALGAPRWFGPVTIFGGASLIAAWGAVAVAAWQWFPVPR